MYVYICIYVSRFMMLHLHVFPRKHGKMTIFHTATTEKRQLRWILRFPDFRDMRKPSLPSGQLVRRIPKKWMVFVWENPIEMDYNRGSTFTVCELEAPWP